MITKHVYTTFDDAYKFFNEKLFDGALPDCLITLQRTARSRGHFSPERFKKREGNDVIHELNMNPDSFVDRTDEEILSTMVHELVHVWQESFGNPPRKCYHNKEWAVQMEAVGLMPSSTGEYGGKKTGQSMTHYIMDDGKFKLHCGAFLLKNALDWESIVFLKLKKQRNKTREKFVCPTCLQNAWAKKTANIMCGNCEIHMTIDSE